VYNRKDSFYRKAKAEGYKSRAAYKLKELLSKNKLIKKNAYVLDCGAAPGGWSQVALEALGTSGLVVACDLEKITGVVAPNFTFIHGDMREEAKLEEIRALAPSGFDLVMSDMAPKTTGIRLKDQTDSIELAKVALDMAHSCLKAGGGFLVKLFDGPDRQDYIKLLQSAFTSVKIIRPEATRKSSYEIYIIAMGYKG
jgi:23S rRNA (uridine2552-2'-O)-methyltransferase